MGRWVLACRPKTLSAAIAPVLVGSGLAVLDGAGARWVLALLALLAATAIQIAANLFNDAIDFRKGADTAARLGPMRITQSGLATPRQVLGAAGIASLAALALGVPLVAEGGWPIVIIGLVSLAFAYGYTGGPLPLAYLGLGDLFVIGFFGLVAVGGVFYLHTGTWNGNAAVAGLQIGCLAAAILAVNNLRDLESDGRSGRRTLPVRFGTRFGRREIATLSLLPFGLNGWWLGASWMAAMLPLASLPLALALIRAVYREPPGPVYNRLLALAAGQELAFGILLSVGMVL
ncbi:MAG: 1,4-dihydroxy-2-naphthoate polyprenyltransferase [Planctomycetes bacterium]|nr:1,4-dihydroxy-2-naphthoate polyprenyltransferase [Planctomycetota bacterium]